MKKLSVIAILLAFVVSVSSISVADAATRVHSYFRSNGTFVQSYYRSNADSYKWNNYSSRGNYNPYTSKRGYVKW